MKWLLNGVVFCTCVSLKSFTPTQYTIAPKDLALCACTQKTVNLDNPQLLG